MSKELIEKIEKLEGIEILEGEDIKLIKENIKKELRGINK